MPDKDTAKPNDKTCADKTCADKTSEKELDKVLQHKHSATWTEAAEEVEKELDADKPATDTSVKEMRDHAAG